MRGKHWLLLAPRGEAARPRRTLQQQLNDPPVLAWGAVPHEIGADSRWAGWLARGWRCVLCVLGPPLLQWIDALSMCCCLLAAGVAVLGCAAPGA